MRVKGKHRLKVSHPHSALCVGILLWLAPFQLNAATETVDWWTISPLENWRDMPQCIDLAFSPAGQACAAYQWSSSPRAITYDETGFWSGTIDPTYPPGYYYGSEISLAFLPSGKPAVSYSVYQSSSTDHDLIYAAGSSLYSWTKTTVDTVGGKYSSLAVLPSGQPAISYFDDVNDCLRYAWFDGSTWHKTVVDNSGTVGRYTDLVILPSGYPAISYLDHGHNSLKYAWFDGTSWQTTVVNNGGTSAGSKTSMKILPSGYPAIAYEGISGTGIKYAQFDGTSWQTQSVVATGTTPSLAILPSGHPAISYQYINNQDPVYAEFAGLPAVPISQTCRYTWYDGSGWQTATPGILWGAIPSLAIRPSGQPAVFSGGNWLPTFATGLYDPTPVTIANTYMATAWTDLAGTVTVQNGPALSTASRIDNMTTYRYTRSSVSVQQTPGGRLQGLIHMLGSASSSTFPPSYPPPGDASGTVSGTLVLGANSQYPAGTALELCVQIRGKETGQFPTENYYFLIRRNGMPIARIDQTSASKSAVVPVKAGETLTYELYAYADDQSFVSYAFDMAYEYRLNLRIPTRLLPNSPPVVAGVFAAPQAGSGQKVDVFYDLGEPDNDSCTVRLQISGDGGQTWTIPVTSATGDLGADQPGGTARHILWDPAVDAPGQTGTTFKARITAEDGLGGSGQGESGLFALGQPAPLPVVSNVLAGPVNDASKRVDVYYDLCAPAGSLYYVYLEISRDGGTTFPIKAGGVNGAVGPNQGPGEGKYICWIPAMDKVTGSNLAVRVVAGGVAAASNVFSLTAAGNGTITVLAYNQATGSTIADVEIVMPGKPKMYTGSSGTVSIYPVAAGKASLSAKKSGYAPAVETTVVRENSTSWVAFKMVPDTQGTNPQVTAVKGNFCTPSKKAYYLNGINLTETFTATVDWNGNPPGFVRWVTPHGTIVQPCSGTDSTCSFNMGRDFGPDETLTVYAQTTGNPSVESAPYTVNLKVVDPPDGVPAGIFTTPPFANELKYTAKYKVIFVDQGIGENVIPADIPVLGAKKFATRMMVELSGEVKGSGTASLGLYAPMGVQESCEIAGGKLGAPTIKGTAIWKYMEGQGWIPGGAIDIGLNASYTSPPCYYPFLGPVPVYLRGKIELNVNTVLQIRGWAGETIPVLNGTFGVNPYVEVMAGPGVADVVSLEFYVGGGVKDVLQYPDLPTIKEFKIYLSGGFRLCLYLYTYENPILYYSFDFYEQYGPKTAAVTAAGPSGWRAMSRDYLKAPAEAQPVPRLMASAATGTTETVLQASIFPQPTPDLIRTADRLMLAWVCDNASRSSLNRTEAVFSIWDGSAWSAPAAMADDGTGDFHPQLAELPNHDVWAAWENVRQVLADNASLEEMTSCLEIAVAKYDVAQGRWSAPTALTSNTCLDRSPHIAAAANGTCLVTWVRNEGNEIMGTADHPNQILFAAHNGTGWSTPAVAAAGLPSIVKSAMAYDGTHAVILFSADTDGDDNTTADRELFALTCENQAWSSVVRLTNNAVEDAGPQVVYLADGSLRLFWYQDGKIMTAGNLSLTDAAVAVDPEGPSSGVADFRLAVGPAGQQILVWQETGDEGVDLWQAVRDPVLGSWSKPLPLTADPWMEQAPAPAIDAAGNLIVVCKKLHIGYETRTIPVGGQMVTVDNVPVPEQSDLYELRHAIKGDLAVEAVTIAPANPLPAATATVTAKVRNRGEASAVNAQIGFYDGNPAQGGTLIGALQTLPQTLAGGSDTEVSAAWTVPASTAPRSVYVVADPNQQQEDRDRTNNAASCTSVKPDLAISDIGVHTAGPDRIVTLRVANTGALKADNVSVVLHQDTEQGAVLKTFTIPRIVAGGYYDVSYRWVDPFALSHARVDFTAVVDPDNATAEFDETNSAAGGYIEYVPVAGQPQPYRISGQITLQDFIGSPASVPVRIELRQAGNPVRVETLTLDVAGGFSLPDVPAGTYDVVFKAGHWLPQALPALAVTDNVTGVSVSLVNGDADGDSAITAADLALVLAGMDRRPGEAGYDARADLDGDQTATSTDLSLLLANIK